MKFLTQGAGNNRSGTVGAEVTHLEEVGVEGAAKGIPCLFFFVKPPRNAIADEGDTVHMPIGTEAFGWEIELAVIIGHRERGVSVEMRWATVRGHNQATDMFYKLD